MASTYNYLKDVDASNDNLIYRIKLRVLKIWSLSPAQQKYVRLTLEFVAMDQLGDRIQCSIRNPQRRLFEDELVEGKIYTICNFSVAINDKKYKATNHASRIYFKRDTQLRLVDDPSFSENVFRFVPNEVILNHTNAQSHLIDVIGLLTAKGDIIEFTKNGKKSNYIVLELDDMGKGKIRCTLWEEFASKLVKHIQEQLTSEYILIVQFAKFNLFKGTMGISNITYNSNLYINADFQAVKDFRKSVIMSGVPPLNQLSQITTEPVYSIEEDLIDKSIYKSISELKECIENGSFVTIGTVVAIDPKNGWWYKSCKHCFHSLKEAENSYHCAKCDTYPTIHTPRYSINIKVVDDTDSAAFLLYDKEASKFLGISAFDLRLAQLTRQNLALEHSQLLSMQSGSAETPKDTCSPSVEILVGDTNEGYSTPKRNIVSGGWTKQLIDLCPNSAEGSSTKCRKLKDGQVAGVDKPHQD
ncbi:Replication protein A 70 kDa DNA-binding subunit B [Arachis hypogaea]|nr:Replication protein A 70 kDa DNA-binding subunit B [Arachis hypogaea]